MSYAKVAARWLVRLVLVAFLGLVLGALAVLVVIPRATHGTALTVLTGSMTPSIPVGSTVVDRPVDPGTLHVGDIATYQKAPGVNEYITHRIVAINTRTSPVSFTFKGDANRGPDMDPVPARAIRGKVWFHVPYLGTIKDGLSGGSGRPLLLAALTVGLAGFSINQFVSVLRGRRRKAGGALEMDFAPDAFGEAAPGFVAEVLQGEVAVNDDATTRLTFTGSAQRLDVLRQLLAPFGTPVAGSVSAEAEGDGDSQGMGRPEDVTPCVAPDAEDATAARRPRPKLALVPAEPRTSAHV